MAYYNYKQVRDLIPADFRPQYETKWKEDTGEDYEESCDYDGTLWLLAAAYIEKLKTDLKAAESEVASLLRDQAF